MKTFKYHFITSVLLFMTLISFTTTAGEHHRKKADRPFKKVVKVKVINTDEKAVPVKIVNDAGGSNTHLNVEVGEIVSLESFCILPDNSLDNLFYYDRQISAPFVIPEGYSFVVTDIVGQPSCDTAPGDPADFYLALVEGPQAVRKYTVQFRGDAIQHYTLNGGITYTPGNEPRPRNTSFSAGRIQIQLLGYFVEGDALDPGEPRF